MFHTVLAQGFRRDWLAAACVLWLCACATQSTPPPAATAPTYEGKCWLLGLEQSEEPQGTNQDSVALVATYRFGQGQRSEGSPIALRFRVTRARLDELRAHLEAHPSVVCKPDREPSPETDVVRYTPEVPPFEGQSGEPRPAAGSP